jgi:hypothetical protein
VTGLVAHDTTSAVRSKGKRQKVKGKRTILRNSRRLASFIGITSASSMFRFAFTFCLCLLARALFLRRSVAHILFSLSD